MLRRLPSIVHAALACSLAASAPSTASAKESTMKITSTAFENEAQIPRKYTCEGDDASPPLAWAGIPAAARSLALVVDDPDAPDPRAPKRTWVHWVAYDIPPATAGIEEDGELPEGARDGRNDWDRTGYGGPCPPVGRHRYYFKLYALDTKIDRNGLRKADLEKAMHGHVLAQATLMGTYQKGD
jgi:hypothetical protein